MLNKILFSVLLFGAIESASAASMPPLPYPIEQDLSVVVILNQHEMQVDVPDNSAIASQFGLLGALVGAAIDTTAAKNAEVRIAAIRNLMLDYNFNQKFEQAVRVSLATPGIAVNPKITIARSTGEIANSVAMPGPDAAVKNLQITPRFSMSNNFETVSLSMDVRYLLNTLKSNGKVKQSLLFMRTYRFNIPMDAVSGSQATEDSNRWAALGTEQLSRLADQSIKQVTEMFAFDLSTEGRALSVQPNKGMKTVFKGKEYSGRVLRQTDDYIWMQSGKDFAQTIQGYQPISGIPAASMTGPEKLDAEPASAKLPPPTEGVDGKQ